ncbi:cytochrome c-type biogenesis protein [Coralloluteibacterium thermophilus]|uniref:Cytochrome c-type biogenesis protein n=1 Tax=Coralloluteibacterium thermophilum TaxID=2707049 RepID=A0ABV9NNH9_9GAMM
MTGRCRAALGALLRPLLIVALLAAGTASALEPMDFSSPQEEARFRALVAELRCVMCQNQSLSDSNAPIARDLRAEVLDLMRQGMSDAEIKDYLVERYTEFVLYRPPMRAGTWLLWFGPLLVLGIGTVVVVAIVRRRGRAAPPPADDARNDTQEW